MSERASIKPIETEYRGYRFRSRLEARWAVFFDAARILYEYEPEGFELDDGTKYLPDFYLPEFELYVEIKPTVSGPLCRSEQVKGWEDKCRRFRDSTGKAILIKYGDPAENLWGELFAWECDESGGGTFEENAQFVPVGEWGNPEVIVMTFAGRDHSICVTPDMRENKKVVCASMFMDYYWDDAAYAITARMSDMFDPDCLPGTFDDMRKKARQARFEHGERPDISLDPRVHADELRKKEPALFALGASLVRANAEENAEFLADAFDKKCAELGYNTANVYSAIRDSI